MLPSENDTLTALVSRVMRIEGVTWGDPAKNFIARFQGELFGEDSASAYDQLAEALRPLKITPLFRMEKDRQTIVLLPGLQDPRPSNPWINLIFFLATVFSVFLVGAEYVYQGPEPASLVSYYRILISQIWTGWPYAVSLLAILLSHEFGHYLVSRYHKTAATLPYFLPLPLPGSFGTMGAVIFQREAHKNKRILLDIGMAGPFAGLIVAIPVILLGLSLSKVEPLFLPPGQGTALEGNSVLYLLMKFLIFHRWLPEPATFGAVSPFLYWVRYFFTGQPSPLGGLDVQLHPVAWAGWAGLLVTALNLIPAGQLDGGHIVHGLFGMKASRLLPFVLGALILLGFVWPGWWLWVFLIFFLGRTSAEPLDQITPLDPRRKIMALAGLVIFFLIFTPVPLQIIFGR
jgi:membrane-associated protease RseP (regulator of RpoE activity)